MTINSRGSAVLRGTVNTLEERILLGQRIVRSPGVTEVINLLKVREGEPPPNPVLREEVPRQNCAGNGSVSDPSSVAESAAAVPALRPWTRPSIRSRPAARRRWSSTIRS